MLCFMTARRLRPRSFSEFRRAWEPDEWPDQFVRAYHVRDLSQEDVVVSFGFFRGSVEEYRSLREDSSAAAVEETRQRQMQEFVEETLLDGVFEVVEEVTPTR